MPAHPSDEPLTKITFNIYTTDYEWLKKRFGQGWTTEIRALIRLYKERDLERHNRPKGL